MKNQLGALIGVIESGPFSTKNINGESVTINVKFDFTSTSDIDIIKMLTSDRKIAVQRPLRLLASSAIRGCQNMIIVAHNAGAKIVSRESKIDDLVRTFVASGVESDMALKLATAAVDNPSALTVATSGGENDEN